MEVPITGGRYNLKAPKNCLTRNFGIVPRVQASKLNRIKVPRRGNPYQVFLVHRKKENDQLGCLLPDPFQNGKLVSLILKHFDI
jgi:hypothetical protein